MGKHSNPPAFPRTGEGFGNPLYDTPGMTLRDWFAGQALAGLMAADTESATSGLDDFAAAAVDAYAYADAMLAARDPK